MLKITLLMAFPALMAYAAASDLLTMTIPNKLSLALVIAFGGFALAGGLTWAALATHVAAGALILFVTFGMFACGWIGGGDAKLASVVALWLGFGTLIEYLFLATLAGGALTLALLAFRGVPLPAFASGWNWLTRLHDRNSGVPYGIALAGAALFIYPQTQIWHALLS